MATTVHKRETLLLAALLCAHVLLGVYYSVAIPIWEAHDEIGHYYFVRYLASEHGLPVPGQQLVEENDESRQPPLYYLLASVPLALAGVGDDAAPHLNPHMSRPEGEGGYNRAVHDLAAESWPYHGTALAVHIARWASVVLGACGLLFTFYTARQAFPAQPSIAWGAVLFQAFWPQYRFTTAVVNNDIMAVVCAGALTWLLVAVVTSRRPRPLDMAALVGLLGLALMAKNTTLPLVPIVLLVLAAGLLLAERGARRRVLGYACGGLVVAIGAVAWWYLRNVAAGTGMFGGPYSLRFVGAFLTNILRGSKALPWSLAPSALRAGLTSLWAGYGWNNVGPPLVTYRIAAIWGALGVLGLLIWFVRRPPRRQVAAAGVMMLVFACTTATWTLYPISGGRTDLPGRYLLPVLPVVSVLLSLGWHTLLPKPIRPVGIAGMVGVLCFLAAVTPALYIEPAYALPRQVTAEEVQPYTPIRLTFGDSAELVGYRLQDAFIDPRGKVHLTLLWRVLGRTEVDYSVAAEVFAEGRRLLGEVHRFPAQGTLATTTWQPGMAFTEDMTIGLDNEAVGPSVAWIELSFFNHADPGQALPVTDPSGQPLGNSARLARVKIRAVTHGGLPASQHAIGFGPAMRLLDCRARLGAAGSARALHLDLLWGAAGRPERDYTVSLQLRDSKQAIVRQADSEPQEGAQPTSLWEPGETVPDPYSLQVPARLPEGTYTLYLSVYHLPTLERLQVTDEGGQVPANREVALLSLSLEPGAALEVIPVCPLVHVAEPQAGS